MQITIRDDDGTQYYMLKDVADMTGIAGSTLRQRCLRGLIPAKRVPEVFSMWVISEHDIPNLNKKPKVGRPKGQKVKIVT